jgi:hypothetical protein
MSGWVRVRCSGSVPPAVDRHSAASVGHQVFVFGGCDGVKRLNTVNVLDTGTTGLFVLLIYLLILSVCELDEF